MPCLAVHDNVVVVIQRNLVACCREHVMRFAECQVVAASLSPLSLSWIPAMFVVNNLLLCRPQTAAHLLHLFSPSITTRRTTRTHHLACSTCLLGLLFFVAVVEHVLVTPIHESKDLFGTSTCDVEISALRRAHCLQDSSLQSLPEPCMHLLIYTNSFFRLKR